VQVHNHRRVLERVPEQLLCPITRNLSLFLRAVEFPRKEPMSPFVEPKERADSFSSSSAETRTSLQENEKLAGFDSTSDDEEKLRSPNELDIGEDDEDDNLLQREVEGLRLEEPTPPPKTSFSTALMWMAVNTIATVGIVSLPL